MTEKPTEQDFDAILQIQTELEDAISSAVKTATRRSAEHPYLGHPARRQSEEHFTFVALFRLYLMFCGADLETHKGGNVRKAASMLRVGEKLAQGWQKENSDFQRVKLKEGMHSAEEDLKERSELLRSARQLGRDTLIQALVDHVSKDDPNFRERVKAAVEKRLGKIEPGNETDEIFAEGAREFTRYLLRQTL